MIATMSVPPQHTGVQHHRHLLAFAANAAGDPLPLIPRRSQPQAPVWPLLPATQATPSPSIPASASLVTITPATPPKTESDSDSTPLRRGKKRKRDLHLRVPNPTALYPPELSTPIPTPRSSPNQSLAFAPISKNSNLTPSAPPAARAPIIYTPGIPLRLSMESLRNLSAVGLSLHSVQSSLRPSSPVSESLSPSSSLSSVASTPGSQSNTPLIRKKSGQVVRPSLKSSSSYSANLGIVSPRPSLPSSKSEPVTPFRATTPTTSKAVHFDKNLERVKLFLTEQKPLAVSREGSPGDTDDGETSASGTETNEVARFFGLLGDPNKKPNPVDPRCPFGTVTRCATKLLMHTNLPSRTLSLCPSSPDATLESLLLAKGDKSIQGIVLVRNIAYDKTVTARFSFDGWCTTSEVNARWKEGIGAPKQGGTEWDRFEFTIWLGDLKLGEEEKGDSRKLELAVRYRVSSKGYELWDNNGGRNYVATFERPGLLEEKARGRKARLKKREIPPVPFSDDELSDLLERVAISKTATTTTRKARSISPTVSNPEWTPSASTTPPPSKPATLHTRTRSFPFSASSSPHSVEFGWMTPPSPPSPPVPAWLAKNRMFENRGGRNTPPASKALSTTPAASLGSPRDLGDDIFHSRIKFPTLLGNNDPEESMMDDARPEGRKRGRHQLGGGGGYFDYPSGPQESRRRYARAHDDGPAEQTTPTPPPSSRFHSFPPLRSSPGPREPVGRRVKDPPPMDVVPHAATISIPSLSSASFVGQGSIPSAIAAAAADPAPQNAGDTSDSSSTSTLMENESPTSSRSSTPPSEEEEEEEEGGDDEPVADTRSDDPDDRELYKEFLNKFCFFTGPGSVSTNTGLDLDPAKNRVKMNESSSESSTPTLTPSGSI